MATLVVCASLLVGAAPAAAATPSFGFADFWDTPTIALSSSDGSTINREFVLWESVQPSSSGGYEWGNTDALYATMLAAGIKPLWVLHGTPSWARDRSLGCASQPSCPPTASAQTRWVAFAQAMAQRYPGSAGIEVWNEPNWKHFWLGTADRYTSLLNATYKGIKAVAPAMPVVSAGLAGGGKDTVVAQTWLGDMYDAGAKGHMDGIGLHLYPGPRGGPVVFDVQEHLLAPVRAVIAKNRDTATPLWITEFGIPTDGDGSTFYRQSEDAQASMLGAVTADLLCAPDIDTLLIWRYRDGPTPDGESTMGMGVRHEDLSAKPALAAVKAAVQNAATTPCVNPSLAISADAPMPLKVGQAVNLTVAGMPAGATSFTWDLTGRGYFGTKTDGPTLTRAFAKAGHYRPAVHVSDGLHVWSAAIDIDVGTTSKPTAVIISSPGVKAASGVAPVLRIKQWQRVVFDSRQSHADTLTAIKQVTWHVQRKPHGKDWRNHAKVLRYAWRKAGTMRIGLEVRDKHGATGLTWIKVIVKPACNPAAKHCGKKKRKKTRA